MCQVVVSALSSRKNGHQMSCFHLMSTNNRESDWSRSYRGTDPVLWKYRISLRAIPENSGQRLCDLLLLRGINSVGIVEIPERIISFDDFDCRICGYIVSLRNIRPQLISLARTLSQSRKLVQSPIGTLRPLIILRVPWYSYPCFAKLA